MSDQRTKDTIQRLAHKRPGLVKLPDAADPAPILAKTGLGSSAGVQSSTGIASPLIEPDYATRTWHSTRTITSTDGLFTIEYNPLATMDMTDANGFPVVFQFDDPA